MTTYFERVVIFALLMVTNSAIAQADLSDIEAVQKGRIQEGQQAQEQVDVLAQKTREMLDDYHASLRNVDGLETYVQLLDRQLDNQEDEIEILRQSLNDVALVERQILPILVRMIDALEQFVAADVPFLSDERKQRVSSLRAMLERSDVTVAEKARRVFEAYQIENEYGRTIERYTAKVDFKNKQYDAEFLRIGRLGLMFRAFGGGEMAYWNQHQRRWESAPDSPWRRLFDQGLRVAGEEIAPQMIFVNIVREQVKGQP